jgi:hypothetical protein
MTREWYTLEFIGGPLDGALRPVQAGADALPLANGAVIHLYTIDDVYTGHGVRQVMRHTQVLNVVSNRHQNGRETPE